MTAEDLKRASEDATRHAVEELRAELQRKIPSDPDLVVPDGAREVVVVEVTQPNRGDRFDRFPVAVRARGRLFVIRRSQVTAAIASTVIPNTANLTVRTTDTQPNLTMGSAHMTANQTQVHFAASGDLVYWREQSAGAVAEVLKTSTPAKAEAYLRGRDEIESFRTKRFPLWLWFIPERAGGLEITVEAPNA